MDRRERFQWTDGFRECVTADSQESAMNRFALFAAAVIIVLPATAHAQASETVDVAKISCDQFAGFKITDPRFIAIWLSGYYNGKRGNTVVDLQGFNDNYQKLRNYCIVNPTRTMAQAVETLFGAEK